MKKAAVKLIEKKDMNTEKENVLEPELTISSVDGKYVWAKFHPEATGLTLVQLTDPKTDLELSTTIANPDRRTSAHRAWAGARHSRAAGTPAEIMFEMGEKGVDPDQKIDDMFRGYGHASVGDMAMLEAGFMGLPMHFPFALFHNVSVGAGQEKSTRYQSKFGKGVLHSSRFYLPDTLSKKELTDFETEYQSFGTNSLEYFAKHRASLTPAYTDFFQPDPDNKSHQSALGSRVLDSARFFLLLGQSNGMYFQTSAREWSRMIAEFRGSPIPYYHQVADQLQTLFAPTKEEEQQLGIRAEAPSLIRHTDKASTANSSLNSLKNYLANETKLLNEVRVNETFKGYITQSTEVISPDLTEGQRLLSQHVLTSYPGLDTNELFNWIKSQSPKSLREMSAIIFQNHTNYAEMPNFDRVTGMGVILKGFMGEQRDFNRHRAFGRFMPMPLLFGEPWSYKTAKQIINRGFGLPAYLTEVPKLKDQKEVFTADMQNYYQKLLSFVDKAHTKFGEKIDYTFALNLLPMAHQMDLWMYGDPKQFNYMTNQRVRPGGHINYRLAAFDLNQQIADSDPMMEGIRLKTPRPNPASREEFFDRS